MDIRQIERLMRTMQEHGVTALELNQNDTHLSLKREGGVVQVAAAPPAQAPLSAPVAAAPNQAPEAAASLAAGQKEVLSPMVGTYHPHPKNPASVGSKLKKGDVLCVIEAMKLMNDILMEEDGEITFLSPKDGDMVEFGQVIAQFKPL